MYIGSCTDWVWGAVHPLIPAVPQLQVAVDFLLEQETDSASYAIFLELDHLYLHCSIEHKTFSNPSHIKSEYDLSSNIYTTKYYIQPKKKHESFGTKCCDAIRI
jgi:hypothetical protein